MSSKTVIRGGAVLTLGARTANYVAADVLIEDGRIAEVGSGLRSRGAEVVDATEAIVMPGFVDTHRHVWKSLYRNLGDAAGGSEGATVDPEGLEAEDVYASTLIGLLGAAEAGVTSVVDWADGRLDPAAVDAALQAHADSGLRTVFAPAATPGGGDAAQAALRRLEADGAATTGPSTTLAFGSDEPARLCIEQVAAGWTFARQLGLRIHAHAGSERADGVLVDLAARGLLGDDVTLVHCSKLGSADLDAIGPSGAAVSLNPSREMAMGLGAPPIQELIDRGIRPGLGVDDERIAPGDLFAQMRAIISIQHATYFDRKLAGKGGLPNLLTTREVIRYATVDGARVAGLGAVTGSLEPGKQADVIVLRTDRPNIFPINDPIGAVVWGMDTSNLDWVFVGGKAVMRDGALTADVARARELATAAQRKVLAPAGSGAESGGTA